MKAAGNNFYTYRYPDCTTQPAFTGELLEKPRKIILMMIFSFELDTLEVALKEQEDMVDKIFLVESSATHKGVGDPVSCLPVTIFHTLVLQASAVGEGEV